MNAATETSESFVAPTTAARPVRPFYWSVMRELWENRSLTVAPLIPGALALLAIVWVAIANWGEIRALAQVPAQMLGQGVTIGFGAIAYAISIIMHVAVFFYLLDALQGERKDRSVLFWKSMPVSDTTTVLSKIFTALFVSGAIVVAVAVVTILTLLVVASLIALIAGVNPLPAWGGAQLVQTTVAIIYWQFAIALWYAPVAGWLLLVSAWAKRVTILWAVFIPVAVAVFERVAMRTHYVQDAINSRLNDPVLMALAPRAKGAQLIVDGDGINAHGVPHRVLDLLDPVGFFSNPWLWVGLIVAAGFVAASIWMRRYREPL
ncbi:MAG TPA: hypothetical protein VJS12_13600 [Steroidobacteraceae bacterium]|nr:hypothetical protein [Steroidobacteraceae bacterium]